MRVVLNLCSGRELTTLPFTFNNEYVQICTLCMGLVKKILMLRNTGDDFSEKESPISM
jgi:hypothetical protein